METEAATKQVLEQETVKEETTPTTNFDFSKIEAAINSLNERLDKYEKNRLSAVEIRKQAEQRILEAKVNDEVDNIKLENQVKSWEKQKTKLEIRNDMWEQLTRRFANDEIPRSHIRAGLLDNGWNSGIGQMLNLALFWTLAPNNGVSIEDLKGISLTAGEGSLMMRNKPKNIIKLHGRLG